MRCANRDADLLLLAHGELTFGQRLGIYLHLGRCAACRERLRQFSAVSATLALGTRPTLALASGMGPEMLSRSVLLKIAIGTLVLGIILIMGMMVGIRRFSGGQTPPVPRCAPDLASDRCR